MKDERPDFVVLTVINEELEAVRKVLEEKTGRKFKQRINPNHPMSAAFLELEINGQKVFLVKPTDKGNTPAATLTRAIIDYWNPRYLLIVGIGGGVKDVGKLCGGKRRESDLKIGDVIFSGFIHYYDYWNIEGGQEDARPLTIESPSGNLRSIAQSISQKWEYNSLRAREGIILTGDKVINDPDYARKIVCSQFKRESVVVFETEAGGVARAVYDVINEKKPSFLVIRGISDFVDDPEGRETRKNNRNLTAEAAAAFAYELIREIAEAEGERRQKNLKPYLDEAKRLFEEKNPVDNKAPKEYYVSPNTTLIDKNTWDKQEADLNPGEEWDINKFLENSSLWYLVIGAPFGMGKTTYVKHLAYVLATEFDKYRYVPIFIRLREWFEKDFESDAVTAFETNELVSIVISKITSSRAKPLLVLDGLDEYSGSVDNIRRWITRLHEKHFDLKVIITTRLKAGIPDNLHFKQYVRILRFDDEQVDEFFRRYGIMGTDLSKVEDLGLRDGDLRKPLFCWMIANALSQVGDVDELFISGDEKEKTAFFYYVLTHLILIGKHLQYANQKDFPLYEREKKFLRLAAAFMNLKQYLGEPIVYNEMIRWINSIDTDLGLELNLNSIQQKHSNKSELVEPFLTSYFYLHNIINGKTVEFIHQSFQDYFLAEYYYEHILEGRAEMLNVGIPSKETLVFLKGLVKLSQNRQAINKLKTIENELNTTGPYSLNFSGILIYYLKIHNKYLKKLI